MLLPLLSSTSPAVEAGSQAPAASSVDVGGMILHHISNITEKGHHIGIDLWEGVRLEMPDGPVLNVGGVTIDLSLSKHVIMMLLAALLLIIMSLVVRRRVSLIPRGFVSVIESFVMFIKNDIAEITMGHHAAMQYTPFLCTAFFFILTCNLLGLVPYGTSATGNVNVTAALAFMSFLLIQWAGLKKLGVLGYLRHLIPPGVPFWLAPVMFVVELMGVFAKPFALCIRLFANMVAGHVVILSLISLIFVMSVWVFPLSVAFGVFMYVLELFVAFLQAYVFTMLTSLFIGLLVASEH